MSLHHEFPFDPTYGYDQDSLLKIKVGTPPADFASFWRDTYQEVRQIPLRLASRVIPCSKPDLELLEVEYDSLDGARIGAWVTVPKSRNFSRGVVVGHGYGGRGAPDLDLAGPPAAAIYPCARGFHRSLHAAFPDNSPRHVLHGIQNRNSYIHRGCVADYWAAASALLELFPSAAQTLHYMGGSFGGGIGAMLLPWDQRFHKGFIDVPSFGNHPLRLQVPCVGSGESVRRHYQKQPEVTQVLQYFDSAFSALFINIPVLVAAALFDPAVPPQGQFSVYNSLAGQKELFVRKAAHFSHPDEAEENQHLRQVLNRWFAAT